MEKFGEKQPNQDQPVWIFHNGAWRPAILTVGMYPLHGDVRARMQWSFLNGEAAYVGDDDYWHPMMAPPIDPP